VVILIVFAWVMVTVWYLTWGLLLVPYRLVRRGARKRKVEALRHRELLGTIQGSAAASAAVIVTGKAFELLGGKPSRRARRTLCTFGDPVRRRT
jgi:hypothetical protein